MALLAEPQDGCRSKTCSYDEVCVVQNGVARCVCPLCKDHYYDPVSMCCRIGGQLKNAASTDKKSVKNHRVWPVRLQK